MTLPAASLPLASPFRSAFILFTVVTTLAIVAGLYIGGIAGVGAAPAASYSVQAGDTLYAISIKFGIGESDRQDWINAVMRLNGLSSADLVRAGQVLTLPGATAAPATMAPS